MDWKVAVFVVCAIIMTATGIAGLMQLADELPQPLSCEREGCETEQRSTHTIRGRGVYPGFEDTTEDELFDSTVFVMSHDPGDLSQKILVQGNIYDDPYDIGGPVIITGQPNMRYCFAIRTSGGAPLQNDINSGPSSGTKKGDQTVRGQWYNIYGFNVMEEIDANGCFTFIPSLPEWGVVFGFQADMKSVVKNIEGSGIPHGSILRVHMEHYGGGIWPLIESTWGLVAKDEALLITGLGQIRLDRHDSWQVGETGRVTVEIPYINTESQSEKGHGGLSFYFTASHEDTGQILLDENGIALGKVRLNALETVFNIPVLPEYYVGPGTPPKSLLRFALYNELLEKDVEIESVVIDRETAPLPPIVSFDKEEYSQGDRVVVDWECPENPKSNASIMGAWVVAFIGGMEQYYQWETGTEGMISFIASISGILEVKPICFDSAGQGTGKQEKVVVHNVIQTDWCSMYPDDPVCRPGGPAFPLWEVLILTLAIIGAIFLTVIVAYVMNSVGIPIQYSIIASALIFLVIIIMIVFLGQGSIDAIMEYMAAQG